MLTSIVIGDSVRFSDGGARIEVPLADLREIIASVDGDPSEGWLSVEDAAEALSVGESTVRLWLQTGRMKGSKVGRRWQVRPAEVRRMGGEI